MMVISSIQTKAGRELELQNLKWKHEDILKFFTYGQMVDHLVPDDFGGVQVVASPSAKTYRNTLRRIATLQNLIRSYK